MNKNFLKSLFLLALLQLTALFAQDRQTSEYHNLKLAFEFGTNITNCEFEKTEQVRESHYSYYYYKDEYYYDYGHFSGSTNLQTFNFGVKPEIFVYNNRIGISSGLRFTYAKSELASSNDLLWKLQEESRNTYYVQIKDIRQNNYLLSIPLEVRYFMNDRELPFQTYFKVGASMNYRIHSNNPEVIFTNNMMKKYEDLVQSQIPKNNAFSSFLFGAVGFKIGKFREGSRVPWGNIEFQFPYVLMTENSFAFAGMYGLGAGFQMSFQIPIGKNAPIGSK